MLNAKEIVNLFFATESLKLYNDSLTMNLTQYQQVIDSLQYLSLTCPDILFAFNKLSQFMHRSSTMY